MTSIHPGAPTRDDDVPYRFWCEEKLRNMDTDQFGHVNNAAIASFCEAGRMSLFAQPEMRSAMGDRTIVVVKLLITFGKELFYPGAVRIGTSVSRVGRTSFDVVQGIFKDADLVSTSEATCVMLDGTTRLPTPVPEFIREFLLRPKSAGGSNAR